MDLRYNNNVTKADQNDKASRAYLGKTVADSSNVMGAGQRLSEVNAVSWLDRIGLHTKTAKSGCAWCWATRRRRSWRT